MLIKHFILTGDTHGQVATRLGNIARNMPDHKPEETAVIILGDAGFNFWLNNSDKKQKKRAAEFGYTIYCVRGNHEERPENLGYVLEYDANVGNMVYFDPDFSKIRYFVDGGNYVINGHPCLVVGGAYSIDKWYRIKREIATGEPSGWFKDEQLTEWEMNAIIEGNVGKQFDFVFSHTCPISWEPTDLFIQGIDQSMVDKTMEVWLDKLKDTFKWCNWCFGHYHADRIERPCVEQFYYDYEDMEVVWNRWYGNKTYAKEWWLPKSPYMEWWDLENEIKVEEIDD